MQDSYQLADDNYQQLQLQQQQTDNQINLITNMPMLMTSIISPKNNRRLAQSYNTASQQSLAYSNSTYHNKLTQRSPPLFNIDYLNFNNQNNDQNVNTLNYYHNSQSGKSSFNDQFNKNELISTFGPYGQNSRKALAIKFDRITQQSGIQSQGNSFLNNNRNNNSGALMNEMSLIGQQLIELPCFLSLQNSPQNIKMAKSDMNNHNRYLNDHSNEKENEQKNKQLQQMQIIDVRQVYQKDSLTIPMKNKNYKKINPAIMGLDNRMNDERQASTTRRQFLCNNKFMNNNKHSNDDKHKQKTNDDKHKQKTNDDKHKQKTKKNIRSETMLSPQFLSQQLPIKQQSSEKKKKNIIKSKIFNNFNRNNIKSQQKTQQQTDRIKELQYQLRVSEIQREQLRTRVAILNQLLSQKFLQHYTFYTQPNYINKQQNTKNNHQNHKNRSKSPLSTKNIHNQSHHSINTNLNKTPITNNNQQQSSIHEQNIFIKQNIQQHIDIVVQLTILKKQNQLLIKQNEKFKQQLQYIQKLISLQQQQQHNQLSQNYRKIKLQQKSVQVNVNKHIDYKKQKPQQSFYQMQQQIIQLKQKIKQYQQQQIQTQQTISLLQDKQKRFQQLQRPKLLNQIKQFMQHINQLTQKVNQLTQKVNQLTQKANQLTQKANEQKETIDKLEMENNLIKHINATQNNSVLIMTQSPNKNHQSITSLSNGKHSFLSCSPSHYQPQTKKVNQTKSPQYCQEPKIVKIQNIQSPNYNNIKKNTYNHHQNNNGNHTLHLSNNIQNRYASPLRSQDNQLLLIQKDHQLTTLKNQRDYFHTQYQSLKTLQQTNYKLQLKIQDLQNQLSSIKQLIQIDDQITF